MAWQEETTCLTIRRSGCKSPLECVKGLQRDHVWKPIDDIAPKLRERWIPSHDHAATILERFPDRAPRGYFRNRTARAFRCQRWPRRRLYNIGRIDRAHHDRIHSGPEPWIRRLRRHDTGNAMQGIISLKPIGRGDRKQCQAMLDGMPADHGTTIASSSNME